MKTLPRLPVARRLATLATIVMLAGCTTTPTTSSPTLAAGEQATVEGSIVSVDTTPWTYDGSAVVRIAASNGQVDVHLPARWNLCKAPPPEDVQALKAGDRVQATGTVSEDGALVVCERAEHGLRRAD
ncbi:hypothetical protein FB548_0434 [Pseudoxanthomonas sp. 3HH-4]|uniref:hypothetical protein n=1 Tax=Pseudoxanthomonas sp. 3HH-4 TaxID=1690214 RepID=UPI001150A3BC|nr:hypothetical protein [Pseudoxanthomonas sp. 3HH-4]TQM17066.1 hypothetical protein FB548_0434 [Pseudoxanthomonas sp. 3HH-4]